MSSTKSLNDNSTVPLINESEIMPELNIVKRLEGG